MTLDVSSSPLPRPLRLEFDIALSFAGENRMIVEQYAKLLKQRGLTVFLDSDYAVDMWGTDLYATLDHIYRNQALFCVMFLSQAYAKKRWTSHERKSAQARAFIENREYILPVRVDDTDIPGIRETVGYVDLREISLEDLADLTVKKVKKVKERIRLSDAT
ncbi:TIR domain-containing protein [Candidatus Eisenbacteria bacterium]|uniref:TIR domain-containing protein n=1 Tax=Eiseniibacteriota bacterium TaxID=2212470 RepID=A0ABV6YMK1_UNCEI